MLVNNKGSHKYFGKACEIIAAGRRYREPLPAFDFCGSIDTTLASALSEVVDLKALAEFYGLLSGLFVCWDIAKDEPGAETITRQLVGMLKSDNFVISDFRDIETLSESYLQKTELKLSKMRWFKNVIDLVPYYIAAGMEKGFIIFEHTQLLIESYNQVADGSQKA
ncbi:MAG: hypothetical protein GQF41_4289 [Candidatus Rifleibacterium amylolyticum]|nr:MAG: hypothetical protein GQF41_4289 [Candidatus Rifleibacterium amylolyticum]